jgi:hypothetical protein
MRRLLLLIWLGAACAPRSTESHGEDVTETRQGCEGCVADLVDCVSRSRGDAQFMQCRDLFAACQSAGDLPQGACSNPRDEAVSDACGARRTECEETDPDPARCVEDETECLDRLEEGS